MVETGTNARLAAGAATIVRRAPSGPTGAANGRARWNVSVTGSPLRVRAIGVGATAAGPSAVPGNPSDAGRVMRRLTKLNRSGPARTDRSGLSSIVRRVGRGHVTTAGSAQR